MITADKKPSKTISMIRGHKRALFEGFKRPWKNPLKSFLTILTLAICFYIPLFLWTLWLNYDELKHTWEQQGTIAVFLDSQIDLKESGIMLQEIKESSLIKSAGLVTAQEIKSQLNEDEQLAQIIDLIKAQDLPKQINLKINPDVSVDEIEAFVNNLSINPKVEYVSYDKKWLSQLQGLTQTLLQMARISAIMFILIIMVILANTIGNEITDYKSELRLLELIGATWAQVRRSFLYMGTFYGIYAGILAVIFLSVSFWWLQSTISNLGSNFALDIKVHGLNFWQILMVISISILVTWLAARLTLTSHKLSQIES